MPLDPSISLGVTPQQQRDPLNTLDELMRFQLYGNQNALFQQKFAAQKAMGPIFQQSVDPQTGEVDYDKALSIAARTPAAAFLVPEMANTIAQRKLTQTQMQGAQLEQAGKVFGGVSGVFADAIAAPDPAKAINARLPSYIATLPKEQQPAAYRAAKSFIDTIPADAGPDQVRQWLSPFAMAAKTGSDQIEAMRGKVQQVQQGNKVSFQQVSPLAGTVTPVGETLPMGVTPDTAVTMQKVGVDAQGRDILAPKGQAGNVGGVSRPGGGAQPSGPAGNVGSLGPGAEGIIAGASKNYTEEGRKAYEGALGMRASLRYMDANLDALNDGTDKFLEGGTAAEFRTDVAKTINTASTMFGGKPVFNPEKLGHAEDFIKETKRAGFGAVTSAFGAQREAATVIEAAISSVPGINNTPAGAKLVLHGLQEVAQREIDRRNFETNWAMDPKHAGNLTGANEVFNQKYDPQKYADRALSTMTPHVVKSEADLKKYLPGTQVRTPDGKIRIVPGPTDIPVGAQ